MGYRTTGAKSLTTSLKALSLTAALLLAAAPHALAQQVAVIVNGQPITSFDIDQRSKLTTLTTHKTPPRQQVLEELIDEKIKVSAGKRYHLEMTDLEVDQAMGEMAGRMRMNAQQLTQMLTKEGVSAYTLRDRIRAETVWQQLVRGKFQASFQINEKQIDSALQNRNEKEVDGVEYTLQPILFFVARGAGEEGISARKRDVEALRARFDSCQTGLPVARSLRSVAVRAPIVKTSADLAPALREILDKVQVGHLTDPEVTPQGIQVFALCKRQATKVGSAAKKEVQNEMFSEQFKSLSSRFLAELRKQAMIEYKDGSNARTAGDNRR
jgi:peptidyl-prolyl cis-trans isomerase SurA